MLCCDRIHFIGIGGVGMSGLAWVLARQGKRVTGSDIAENSLTRRLLDAGIKVFIGHDAANLGDAELVIISSAIKENNPELRIAQEKGIPIRHRSQLLAEIVNVKRGIAISGTHGKTTTTSMVSMVLKEAGLEPTIFIGAELEDVGGNAESGVGDFVIAEADESDGSLLNLEPEIAIITNIEAEHLDFYRDFEHEIQVFSQFAARVKEEGVIVISLDDYGTCRIIDCVDRCFITYSVRDPEADILAADIRLNPWSSEYMCVYKGELYGKVQLSVPGLHNVSNSLAALGVGLELGLEFDSISESLYRFHGASRRFQIKGSARGITIIDDYAHHPTEVSATLKAARRVAAAQGGRVISVFQPHRFSRTLHLGQEFGAAFDHADVVLVTDVYPAGEHPIEGITGEIIVKALQQHNHPQALYCPAIEDIEDVVMPLLKENDVLMTMGAGNIWAVGEKLISLLSIQEGKERVHIQP